LATRSTRYKRATFPRRLLYFSASMLGRQQRPNTRVPATERMMGGCTHSPKTCCSGGPKKSTTRTPYATSSSPV